jgi:hypothetical protein
MAKLAVITCHYNWAGFDMPVRNLRRFLRQMDRYKVPVYGVELYLKGHTPEMAGTPGWRSIPVTKKAILWQKEALLNMAERMVPPEFGIIAAIDADVEFTNPNWHRDTLRAMTFHPVVQMFHTAHWTDRRGRVTRSRGAVTRLGLDMEKWTTHPGFAWAFDRALYREMGGWYDVAPMGAGDTLLCIALQKKPVRDEWMEHAYSYLGPKNRGHFDAWAQRVRSVTKGMAYGYVPGDLIHEWHGDWINRRYHERAKWIAGYDIQRHTRRHKAGYLQWSVWAPSKLRDDMVNYFLLRDEDGKTTPEQ